MAPFNIGIILTNRTNHGDLWRYNEPAKDTMVINAAALVRRSSPWQRNVLVVTGLEPSISAQVGAESDVVKANPEVFLF